jgi:hypothetical protein
VARGIARGLRPAPCGLTQVQVIPGVPATCRLTRRYRGRLVERLAPCSARPATRAQRLVGRRAASRRFGPPGDPPGRPGGTSLRARARRVPGGRLCGLSAAAVRRGASGRRRRLAGRRAALARGARTRAGVRLRARRPSGGGAGGALVCGRNGGARPGAAAARAGAAAGPARAAAPGAGRRPCAERGGLSARQPGGAGASVSEVRHCTQSVRRQRGRRRCLRSAA